MEICDVNSKGAIRKRTLVDEKGFQFPAKALKKAASQPVVVPDIATSNMFGKLIVDLHSAGHSTSADPEPRMKKVRIPPIVVSPKSHELIKKLNLIISKDVNFACTRRGLKVRTSSSSDYRNTEEFLHQCKIESFTFNYKPGNFEKYVLGSLNSSTECDMVSAGLTEKIFHVRQVNKLTKRDEVKSVEPLPVWVVSLEKIPENLNKSKTLKGILNLYSELTITGPQRAY
jgi:hypothetical protein